MSRNAHASYPRKADAVKSSKLSVYYYETLVRNAVVMISLDQSFLPECTAVYSQWWLCCRNPYPFRVSQNLLLMAPKQWDHGFWSLLQSSLYISIAKILDVWRVIPHLACSTQLTNVETITSVTVVAWVCCHTWWGLHPYWWMSYVLV